MPPHIPASSPRLTVVQLLPALHSGGVERSTLEIGRALVAAGHRSVVVSAGGRLLGQLLAEGSEHIALPVGRKALSTLFLMAKLRRTLVGLQPDIVHARSRLPAWLARAALPDGAHWVTTVHGLNSPGRYSGIMASGERVICVSETVKQHVLTHWPKTDPARLRVIERGVDPAAFARTPVPSDWLGHLQAEHPQLAGGKLLLMPGRGTRLKGHADALQLVADLRGRGLDVRLWLLGAREPGREAYIDELQAQAKRMQLEQVLAITGPRQDVAMAYRAADLVLQLSRKPEAFGRTVLEALSSGRPVLGWAHGGVGELLARWFPSGAVPLANNEALTATAMALLSNPPEVAPVLGGSLEHMQSATLAVYESFR